MPRTKTNAHLAQAFFPYVWGMPTLSRKTPGRRKFFPYVGGMPQQVKRSARTNEFFPYVWGVCRATTHR